MKTITKTHLLLFLLGLVPFLDYSQKDGFPIERQERVIEVMRHHTAQGIPGLALTVYAPTTGYWSHAEGIADSETRAPLTSNHLFYLQSISKTYMAVTILHLAERGKIDLEDPVLKHLDYPWLKDKEGAGKITIKMLLNHTSGLPEYSTDPVLVSRIIQDPLKVLSPEDMLAVLLGKPMEAEPGSIYAYRNTNYELLALVADRITGDHQEYMKKHIFKKLGLEDTHILNASNYTSIPGIVSAHWDVLLEGTPVNVSKLQKANVASMKGDDGMVASTRDAVDFMIGLASGKLLKPKTLELMQQWVTRADGSPAYGLGISYYDLDVTYALGHSGGGIGAGCVLLYLPELDAVVFIATNFNTMMDSPIREKNEDLQINLLQALFAD